MRPALDAVMASAMGEHLLATQVGPLPPPAALPPYITTAALYAPCRPMPPCMPAAALYALCHVRPRHTAPNQNSVCSQLRDCSGALSARLCWSHGARPGRRQ